MRIHYRVIGPLGKIAAYGCGWAGEASTLKTTNAALVTCDACKRTKEWKAASKQRPSDPQPGGQK